MAQFVDAHSLTSAAPEVVAAKHSRAQTLYALGWLDGGLIKAGELAAFVALEATLADRYKAINRGKRPAFALMLLDLVVKDGLTDEHVPLALRCGTSVIGQLTGGVNPSLAGRRKAFAHGDPFEGFPTAGLLELTRDLVDYVYRPTAKRAGR